MTEALARIAARRPHLFVAEAPDGFLVRVAVEAEARRRRWALATSPADADVLVVCGEPGPELSEPLGTLYEQMPGPRARCHAAAPDDVSRALDHAQRVLLDGDLQQADARDRGPADRLLADQGEHMDHEDMDHGDMDHEGMDHGDMDMSPGGIPLAEGTDDDRDGLEMDVLHLPLGPFLPYWPAGLVLRCSLHGDVVADVEVQQPGKPRGPGDEGPELAAARRLDAVTSVLALAGWQAGAERARRVRDICAGLDAGDVARELAALRRAVRRKWSLRWMLHGIGTASSQPSAPLPSPLWSGDVWDRLLALMDEAAHLLNGDPVATGEHATAFPALSEVVSGAELAAVRLTVASLAPQCWTTDAEPAHA